MKKQSYLLLVLIIFFCSVNKAQYPIAKAPWIKNLNQFDGLDTIKKGQCVIYGSFVKVVSTELPRESYQEIQLKNYETGEIYAMIMKPEFYKKGYYVMAFHILPGNYSLEYYIHSKETLFFRKMIKDRITKTNALITDSTTNNNYYISLKENEVYFIGNWDFDSFPPEFKNNKQKLDQILKPTFLRLNFDSAKTEIPH